MKTPPLSIPDTGIPDTGSRNGFFTPERVSRSLRWLVPLLLASSPLTHGQMLYTRTTVPPQVRPYHPSEELMRQPAFSDSGGSTLAPKLNPAEVSAAADVWIPSYLWSLTYLQPNREQEAAAAIHLAGTEVPEPSITAALFGGLALLLGINFLRRRRQLV